jgi:rhodanese-related sulfurtransferase
MNRSRLSALAAAAALSLSTLTSCGGAATPRVEPRAVALSTAQGPQTIVDIRGRQSYERGHLPYASLMENWMVPPELDAAPKDEPVVVYGDGDEGHDEEMAAAALVKAGFREVSILKGGMAAYAALELPTRSKDDEERASEMIEGLRGQEQRKADERRHLEKMVEKSREELKKVRQPEVQRPNF